MKTITTLISATIIFTGLYLCLVLGNELLKSIDTTIGKVQQHKSFVMEVEQCIQ